jgi:hypothetical protein
MLVVYRTNDEFAGDIVSLDTITPAAAMAAYLAAQDAPDIAYIEIGASALAEPVLGALVASVQGYGTPGRFYVAEVAGVVSLIDGGV